MSTFATALRLRAISSSRVHAGTIKEHPARASTAAAWSAARVIDRLGGALDRFFLDALSVDQRLIRIALFCRVAGFRWACLLDALSID